jgi:hypothetical protein
MRAHKTEAGNPTFVDDLKKKRVKFDAATRRPAASTTGAAALSVPATGHRKTFVSVAETVGNGSADVVMGPPPAAVLPPAAVVLPAAAQFPAASRPPVRPVHPISRSTTAPSPGKRAPPPTAKAKRVRQEVSENGAVAGPGPSTKSNMAAANVRFATPPRKTFTALEEEEEEEEEEQEGDEQEQDEDDQLDGEEAIRMMDEEGPRPRTRSKGIGKIVENDGESSDWDAYRRSPVRVRPRASRASRRTAAPRAPRSAPRRTGRELQPPCSTCQLADKICQESVNGGACFSCKQSKRKCEFAEKKTVRKVKSKARIESDDDEEETQVTPPPSSRARGTRQSSRAAGKQRARSPDVTMDRGATMEIEREVQANAEVVYQPTHLRPGVRAAGVAQSKTF